MPEKRLDQKTINQIWLDNLTGNWTGNWQQYLGPLNFPEFRTLMKWLPKNPRCQICNVPFSGVGGRFVKIALGRDRSKLNPSMCNVCERFASEYQGDAVNTAARLASNAGPGEILVSEQAWKAAGLDAKDSEARHLQLKGRSEAIDVRVLRIASSQTE